MVILRPLHLAVIALAAIPILQGAKVHLSLTVLLILGIVAVVLVILDLIVLHGRGPARVA